MLHSRLTKASSENSEQVDKGDEEAAIIFMLQRGPDCMVVMVTTFFPGGRVEELMLFQENWESLCRR